MVSQGTDLCFSSQVSFPSVKILLIFFLSLVFSVWQVLKKALEFFVGMVRPGTIDTREQKITLSEAASLGQTSVFLKHLPDRKDTVPAREKDALESAGLGGAK